jgi:two-component system OmpR family response regulator
MSGFEVCRILRKESPLPILILSAKTEELDKVIGLEVGADDYVTKPFSIKELMTRVKVLLRRTAKPLLTKSNEPVQVSFIRSNDLEVDLHRHQVHRHGTAVDLTPKEFEILAFLMQNRGRVFHRNEIVDRLWSHDFDGNARTVDVHLVSLRKKIKDDPTRPTYIKTIRGYGYVFDDG